MGRESSSVAGLTRIGRFLIAWVMAALVICALVAGWYYYNRADEEVRAYLQAVLAEHYAGLVVSVDSVRLLQGEGIRVRGVSLVQPEVPPDTPRSELLYIDELFVQGDAALATLFRGGFQARHLTIRRAVIRATRGGDGAWNVARLWPLPKLGGGAPGATIEDATIEVLDRTSSPASLLTLRDVNLGVTPESDHSTAGLARPGMRLKIHGTLAGEHVQRIDVQAALDAHRRAWRLEGVATALKVSQELRGSLPAELRGWLAPLGGLRAQADLRFRAACGLPEVAEPAARETADPASSGPGRRDAGFTPGVGLGGPARMVAEWPPDTASTAAPAGQPSLDYALTAVLRDGYWEDPRLPYPLSELQATITCDRRELKIADLSARCGAAQVHLSASRAGHGGRAVWQVQARARQLDVDRRMVESLPAEWRARWQKYQVLGRVDVDLAASLDGEWWVGDVTVRCVDVSVLYDRFPYRLTGGRGTVRLRGEALDVDLRTLADATPVAIRAAIIRPGDAWTGWIEVGSQGTVALDDRLVAALEPRSQRVVRAFNPQGRVALGARIERHVPRGDALQRQITIRVENGSMQYDKFAYPLRRVSGHVEMTNGRWSFRDLAGHNDSAYVTCQGHWNPTGDEGLQLEFVATDVPLEDELRGALSPGAQRLWASLRPRGTIDHLAARVVHPRGAARPSLEVVLTKWPARQNLPGRSCSAEPSWFPYALDQLTGTLAYRDGRFELRDLRGMHGTVACAARGQGQASSTGDWHLRLDEFSVERLRLDRDLLAAVPPRLSRVLGKIKLSAPVNLRGSTSLRGSSQQPGQLAATWDVAANVAGADLYAGEPLEGVFGEVRWSGQSQGQAFQGRGMLELDSAIYRGVQLTALRGPFWIDNGRLLLGGWAPSDESSPASEAGSRQIVAQALGGLVAGDAQVVFSTPAAFELQGTLTDGDLAALARDLGRTTVQARGKAFATVQLAGTGQGIHTLRGNGRVRVREADIYELPLVVSLLKILSVRAPDKTAFTSSDIDFRVQGDHLYFDRLDLNGDAISLKGIGEMSWRREIKLDFYTLVGRADRQWPLLRPLLGEASRQFLALHVSGTLDQPRTVSEMLPGLNETLQQLFPELALTPAAVR